MSFSTFFPGLSRTTLRLAPFAYGIGLAVLGSAAHAHASPGDGLGVWEGTGHAHAATGADLGAFSVSVTRRDAGAGRVRSDGQVRLANGTTFAFWQEIEQAGGGVFRVTSDRGTGGGQCFESGICQSYEAAANGHAYATTIAKDAPDRIRVLITELENGKAVRFMDQTLTKKP